MLVFAVLMLGNSRCGTNDCGIPTDVMMLIRRCISSRIVVVTSEESVFLVLVLGDTDGTTYCCGIPVNMMVRIGTSCICSSLIVMTSEKAVLLVLVLRNAYAGSRDHRISTEMVP